MRNNVENIEN